jgi:hypothetical protein
MPRLACASVATLSLLLGPGCRSTPSTPSEISGLSLRGHVSDYRTNRVIPGAAVQAHGVNIPVIIDATTEQDGSYLMTLPMAGMYTLWVAGQSVGSGDFMASAARGDLFVSDGTCVARYGTIVDETARQPIAGATVALAGKEATTGMDGWYHLDFGCSSTRQQSGPTTFMRITHPRYAPRDFVVGRGVEDVYRNDLSLERLR